MAQKAGKENKDKASSASADKSNTSTNSNTPIRSQSKKCPVLTRTCGREEYISLQKIDNEHQKVDENSRIVRDKKTGKLVKIVCKRKWGHISPLEAAALSGDNFLVNILLEQVPPHLKREAALQLRGVLNRTGYAENGGYLAPYKALIKAYEEYTSQIGALKRANKWGELQRLWLQRIGLSQRLLPTYGLQEFCDEKPHSPVPLFNLPPRRSCVFYDESSVDLDAVGISYSIYKGRRGGWAGAGRGWAAVVAAGQDLAAFSRLIEVRTSELSNIIETIESKYSKENLSDGSDPALTASKDNVSPLSSGKENEKSPTGACLKSNSLNP